MSLSRADLSSYFWISSRSCKDWREETEKIKNLKLELSHISKAWLATDFELPHPQVRNPKSLHNPTQLAFLMVATRNRNFIKFIQYLVSKLAISALTFILSSIESVRNGFFGSKIALIAKIFIFEVQNCNLHRKKEIFVFISCTISKKTCEVVIEHRKPKNAPHARTSQVSKKWVRMHTSQLATAHRNLLSHIESHALHVSINEEYGRIPP